jgi:heme O synthase-like polyprenyltransferase
MLKKLLLLGVVSGLLAGVTSLIYGRVYTHLLGVDFSTVAKPIGIVIGCLMGCVLAALGYWVLHRWLKERTEPVFNLVFTVLSFITILWPFVAKLPLEMQSPELFPGLTVPMHFFPVLGWLTLKPWFFPVPTDAKKG